MVTQDQARLAGSKRKGVLSLLAVLALLLLMLVAGWTWLRAPTMLPGRVTIALPTQINSAPVIVAFGQNLFQQAGVEVVNQPFLLGKDALKSVLDGKADLAVVADVPFMFAALDGKDVAILAGISQARRALAIVARKDRSIFQVRDLRGKRIGVTMGANFPYFLDAMLSINSVDANEVTQLDLKTDAIIDSFKHGKIDAAVVFQPYLARLQAEMGDQIQIFYGENVYAFRFLLVGKPAYIEAHPQHIQRILSALVASNQFITSDPVAARKLLGPVVKVEDATMARLFTAQDYVLSLDQAMLLALDDQARWAMGKGLVPHGPVPNFVQWMKPRDLEQVLPSAVKIVR